MTRDEREAMWQLHKELNGYPIPWQSVQRRAAEIAARRPRVPVPIPVPRPVVPPIPRPQQ
jgi:hypothetical protein